MSVAFILNPGYNTINNVHHTFWDNDLDNIKNTSLNQELAVTTSVSAPSHVITGGTDPAQLYMQPDGITLATDAPQFQAPILLAPTSKLQLVDEFEPTTGITFSKDIHMTYDTTASNIDGVGELTCDTLNYTTLNPPITPGVPSAWSEYPATQDVDLADNSLINKSSNTVQALTQIFKVLNFGAGTASYPAQVLVNSVSDDAATSAQVQLVTGNNDVNVSSLTQYPLAATGTAYSGFGSNSGSLQLSGSGLDLALVPGNYFSGEAGKVRLAYNKSLSAVTLNNAGALSFNSDWSSGTPVDGDFGTAGQIVQSNGDAAAPSWVDAPTASNWSTYPATSSVTALTTLIGSSTIPGEITEVNLTDGVFSVSSIPDSTFVGTGPYKTLSIYNDTDTSQSFAQLQLNTQNSGGNLFVNSYPDIHSNGVAFSNAPGATTLQGTGDLVLKGSSLRIARDIGHPSCLSINGVGALSFNTLWTGDSPNPITEGTYGEIGQILSSNGDTSAPEWVDVVVPTSSEYVYYVSKNGTVDATGDVNHPLSTIQAAITLGQASYPRQVVILVAPGVYTESLSITLPNITLLGYSPSSQQNLLTQIVGNVSIACTASQDLFYSQVGIFNLHISGSVIDTSIVVHTLNIEQCRIANNGQIFRQNSSADNRTRLEQVTLLHASTGAGTAPLMQFSSGMATLGLLDVTGRDNAPLLQFDGTGKLQVCGLCTFESTTTSATAAPIVYIAPTSAAGYAYAFGYNSFSYSSPVSRVFSSGKNCGIVCEAGTGHPTLIITYNAFNLLLCNATCFVVQDVKKADALAYTTINFFSNCSTYLATGIDSTHKTTLAAVA